VVAWFAYWLLRKGIDRFSRRRNLAKVDPRGRDPLPHDRSGSPQ